MTEITPKFLDTKSYSAKFLRQFPRDILTEGIIQTDDLKVTQLDTPAMGVKVALGRALVQGDQSEWQGHYSIINDAPKNLSIAASDPTNSRKDRVIAQVKDSIDIGGALDEWELQILTGTPSPSPSPPALPNDALDLAIVLVGNGVSTIVNANITDQRKQIDLQNLAYNNLVTIATPQTITGQKTITSPLFTGTLDGWIASGETWTYASAPTFKISGDKTGKYQKGDKIKLTQNATVKYFYIIGVSYSAPDTTVTITGGIDYTLANAPITSPFYSKIENPQGFPTSFNFTATYAGSAAMTWGTITVTRQSFFIKGNICSVQINVTGTTGGTASYLLMITSTAGQMPDIAYGQATGVNINDADLRVGAISITVGAAAFSGIKQDRSNFALAAGKSITGQISYEF